jgi:hypothetical protein
MRLQDSVQGELHKVPIATLRTLPALPISVVYLVLDMLHLTHHNCIYCPQIDFLETNNPAYKFYLSFTGESLPSSNARLSSSSSSVAKLQSGCSQSNSSDSSNPYHHHICFDNESIWGRDSSSPSNPSIWGTKSSNSRDSRSSFQVYYEDMDDGETKGLQSSGSSSKSCQG